MSPMFEQNESSDWFLPKDVREQLSTIFKDLKNEVVLEVFTQPGNNDEFNDHMVKFCTDVARITDKVTVHGFEIPSARSDERGVASSPTLCINPDDYHIRFLGAPLGEEGKSFITSIMLVSLGLDGLSDISKQLLAHFDEKRLTQVFVNPSCPYCPGQVMNAIKCAIAKPHQIKAECVETNENQELAAKYDVGSVPHTVINDSYSQLGLMPEERFVVELIALKSAEEMLEDGTLPGMEGDKAPSLYGTIEPGEVDLVIVGAGPAGLTAGIYAVRAGLKTVVLEKNIVGGQVALTPIVENYPGFATVPGRQLMDIMSEHAREYAPVHEGEGVESIKAGATFTVTTNRGTYSAKAIILTTGATYSKLDAPGENTYFGRGINYCATCDGYLYKGKKVAIIGGGNTALTDALHLKHLGVNVTIIHRRDTFRAEKALQDSVDREGIPVLWNTEVTAFIGDERRIHTLQTHNTKDGTRGDLKVDGAFVAIGQKAATGLAESLGVELTDEGYVKVDTAMRTSIPGIYAAGDLIGGVQQIVTAIGEGSVAAMSAFEDISNPYWKKE